MKRFSFLIAALMLFACSNSNKVEHVNRMAAPIGMFSELSEKKASPDEGVLLQRFVQLMSPDVETFYVPTQRDTMICTEEGTLVHIPKGAFCDKWGRATKGRVRISIQEFVSLKDFVSQGLATRSGDQLLETGGTIHISAYKDDKELRLTDTSEVVFMFKRQPGDTASMDAFYGQRDGRGNMDWSLDPDATGAKAGSNVLVEEPVVNAWSRNPSGWRPGFYAKVDTIWAKKAKVGICNYRSATRSAPVSWKFVGEEKSMHMLLSERLDDSTKIDLSLIDSLPYRMALDYTIGHTGSVRFAQIVDSSGFPSIDSFIMNFIETMPPVNPYLMGYLSPGDTFHLRLKELRDFRVETKMIPKEDISKRMEQFRDKAIADVDQAMVDYYVFGARQLGWLNCDRYVPGNRPSFAVNNPFGENTTIGIVLNSSRSYLTGLQRGKHAEFNNVPRGEEVTLVGFTTENGQVLYAQQQAVADGRDFTITGFRPMSLNQIDSALAQIAF